MLRDGYVIILSLFLSLGLKILQSVASAIGMTYGRQIASKCEEINERIKHRAARRNNVSGKPGRTGESSAAGDLDDNGFGLGISGTKRTDHPAG